LQEPRGAASSSDPFATQLEALGLHDHACAVYDSEEERFALASAFLRIGLARNERCWFIADEATASRILPHVRGGGADVGEALASGALNIATDRGSYLRSGAFEPAEMIAFWESTAAAALRDGYRALRVAIDATAALATDGAERLLEYQDRVARLFRELPLVAISQYDRAKLSPVVFRSLLQMHNRVIHRGEVRSNALFVPPGNDGAPRSRGAEIEHLLTTVVERERSREQAVRDAERFRLALDGGAHGTWEWDVEKQLVACDERFAEIMGLAPSRVLALAELEQMLHPEDLGPFWKRTREHLEGRARALELEFRVRHPVSNWRWVHLKGKVEGHDASSRPTSMTGTLTDVTELRAARERVTAADRLAATATLAAGIAHEINNPLAWITANLGYMKELLKTLCASEHTSAQALQLLAVVDETQQGASRIRETAQSLRRIAGPEEKRPPARCDVRKEVLAGIVMAEQEIARRARMTVSVPPQLPHVVAHEGALRKVLVHLLTNAAQAMQPDRAPAENEIRVAARAENGQVLVEVADTGMGMTPQVKEHMFDPFFTTKGMGQGMGLGLSFSRAIVEAAGGYIEVESALGRGTTLRVVLPEAPAGGAADEEPA
jgi:PAS domain S-box-containing protein